MPLRFPQFSGSSCESFTACGELKGADDELKVWLTAQDTMRVRYRADGLMAAIRFFSGGRRGSHLHFDVSLPAWFGRSAPKPTHKRADIDRVVSRVKQMRIDVSVTAYMRAKKTRVTSPVFSLLDQQELAVDDDDNLVRFKFSGLEYEQPGSAFGKLVIQDSDDDYLIRFSFEQETVFNDIYLPSILNRVDSLFEQMFVQDASP